MPFGVVFAALVLGIVCPWYGYSTFFSSNATLDRIAASVWAIGGVCIALALLSRRRGARACGIAASLLLAIEGVRLVIARGEPLEAMLLLAGLTSALLLLVPRTGAFAPSVASADGLVALPRSRAAVAMVGTLCLLGVVGWGVASDALLRSETARSEAPSAPSTAAATARRAQAGGVHGVRPASSAGGGQALPATGSPEAAGAIGWTTFADGLASAKSRKAPMFVEFYATWCGACKSMERGAFADAKVQHRLQDLVAVRVNAEEEVARGGLKGVDLATKFGVEAYPTLLVLDPAGKEISRLVGAPGASSFLRWLEDALANGSGTRASRSNDTVRIATN